MPQAVAQRLLEQYGLRFCEGYGLTETSAPSHSNPPDNPKQQCLGIPFMSTEARIVSPDTLQEVPQGESGEIVVRGPGSFWRATGNGLTRPSRLLWSWMASAFSAQVIWVVSMRTATSLLLTASNVHDQCQRLQGLACRGRITDVPPSCYPGSLCDLSQRCLSCGETVKAVVLRAGHENTTAEEIVQWCHANMAVYKAPRVVQFVPALPKSGSGKVGCGGCCRSRR